MEIHCATTITEDSTLAIKGLPFAPGDKVEVLIRNQPTATPSNGKYPLRGTLIHFVVPFEPVTESDWEALK